VRSFSEVKPNAPEIELFEFSSVRLIGKYSRTWERHGDSAPALWDKCRADGSINILRTLPNIVPQSLIGWTGDYQPNDKTAGYMVGVFVPAFTPVPEGFVCKDISAELSSDVIAKGVFGEGPKSIINRFRAIGYESPFSGIDTVGWWEGQLYFDGDSDLQQWSVLMPVRRIGRPLR
jgi:hypothetical protein